MNDNQRHDSQMNFLYLNIGCNGVDDCCTDTNQCSIGEGDCDTASDCLSDLICGVDNCIGDTFDADNSDDCCSKSIF